MENFALIMILSLVFDFQSRGWKRATEYAWSCVAEILINCYGREFCTLAILRLQELKLTPTPEELEAIISQTIAEHHALLFARDLYPMPLMLDASLDREQCHKLLLEKGWFPGSFAYRRAFLVFETRARRAL